MMSMSRSTALNAFIGVLASLSLATSLVQADPIDREQTAANVAGAFLQELE
jgi:hypothetical protein